MSERRDEVVAAASEFCDAFMGSGPLQPAQDRLLAAVAALRAVTAPECTWCKGSGCACHFGRAGHPKGLIGWSPCRGCGGVRPAPDSEETP